jgi:HEAT repeat protein
MYRGVVLKGCFEILGWTEDQSPVGRETSHDGAPSASICHVRSRRRRLPRAVARVSKQLLRGLAAILLLLSGCGGDSTPAPSWQEVRIPDDAPEELREILAGLNNPEPLERAYAARRLATTRLAAADVEDYLLLALADGNALVREAAAQSLGAIGTEQAVEPLLELLQRGSEDRIVRTAAAEALGKLRASAATTPLCAALRDPVWHVRYAAAVALGRIGDPSACEALAEIVRYEANQFVRSAAQESLAQMQPTQNGAVEQ